MKYQKKLESLLKRNNYQIWAFPYDCEIQFYILILNLKFYFIFYISQNTLPIYIPLDDNKI
jgi:hypothetical protein